MLFGSLFQQLLVLAAVLVFEVAVLAENERALVVGENANRPTVVVLDGGLVELELPQHAAESRRQVLFGEHLGSRTIRQHGAVDEHHLVAELRDGSQIVSGDEDDATLGAKFAEQDDDGLLGLHVHAGERLVQQDQAPALGQRAGQENPLFLPAAQFADLAVLKLPHRDPAQALLDLCLVQRTRDSQKIHRSVAAHHRHVPDANGKLPVHLLRLRDVGDEVLLEHGADRQPVDFHAAGLRCHKTHDALE